MLIVPLSRVSVKGDAASGYIRSRLYVADASPADSGLYSCWYGNYTSDTVSVHVIAGESCLVPICVVMNGTPFHV